MENNLTIKGENIQRVYEWYCNKKFIVNRKYQRKLVWTVEEKRNFIDSISRQYSVPLFLLVSVQEEKLNYYEIIDGMQRLDAIFSFIQGEFKLENDKYNGYFDLETMALTKQLLDEGKLNQREPKLPRDICTHIANYPLPFSITQFDDEHVEEIFRRINASGRQLSKQDLRQAGAIGIFSELVRKTSNRVRRDSSISDILELSQMRKISLSNRDLNYGIKLEEVFWVRQGIITIKNMRESMDEQMVGQLLAYIILGEDISPSSRTLDILYGSEEDKNHLSERAETIVTQKGSKNITDKFLQVMDEFDKIFDIANKTFSGLVFNDTGSAKVRSFQILFLAIYLLMEEGKTISNYELFVEKMSGLAQRELGNVGSREWNARLRQEKILAIKAIIQDAFSNVKKKQISYPNIEKVENILVESNIEKQMFDLKIGLCDLCSNVQYNKKCLSKIVKTLTAMANTKPTQKGYILLGIADRKEHAEKYETIYASQARQFNDYYITGVQDEVKALGLSFDTYWEKIRKEIETEPIDPYAKSYILRNMLPITYYEKELILFEIVCGDEPLSYNNEYYERNASSVIKLESSSKEFIELMKRVLMKQE